MGWAACVRLPWVVATSCAGMEPHAPPRARPPVPPPAQLPPHLQRRSGAAARCAAPHLAGAARRGRRRWRAPPPPWRLTPAHLPPGPGPGSLGPWRSRGRRPGPPAAHQRGSGGPGPLWPPLEWGPLLAWRPSRRCAARPAGGAATGGAPLRRADALLLRGLGAWGRHLRGGDGRQRGIRHPTSGGARRCRSIGVLGCRSPAGPVLTPLGRVSSFTAVQTHIQQETALPHLPALPQGEARAPAAPPLLRAWCRRPRTPGGRVTNRMALSRRV